MQLVSYRNTENGAAMSRLVNERRSELARLNEQVANARGEVDTLLRWAQDEAVRIVEAARVEAARLLAIEEDARPAVHDIIRSVSLRRGVPVLVIQGPRRDRTAVEARYEAMAIAYQKRPDLSLSQIGKCFGKRDHTSVLHAVQRTGVWRGVPGEPATTAAKRVSHERRAASA